jgi:hypothetical protein
LPTFFGPKNGKFARKKIPRAMSMAPFSRLFTQKKKLLKAQNVLEHPSIMPERETFIPLSRGSLG